MPQSPTLSPDLDTILQPLWNICPLASAMSRLVVETDAADASLTEARQLVSQLVSKQPIAAHPPLVAGLWLYVDELDRSHRVSQSIDDATGSYWHGIMHRREGDFSNSHYWFRKTSHHPAMDRIADYDAHRFIDEVEAAHRRGETPAALVDLQRREWLTLFAWCAGRQ